MRVDLILAMAASLLGNVGLTAFFMLQIKSVSSDPTSLLIAAVTGLAAAIVTIFLIYRKEVKERNANNERHADNIQKIYETIVKETNVNISNNNRLTDENIKQTKELTEAFRRLPADLRTALKD